MMILEFVLNDIDLVAVALLSAMLSVTVGR